MAQLIAMKQLNWGNGNIGLYYDPHKHHHRFYLQILNASSQTWIDDDFAKQWAVDAGTPYENIKHLFKET